MGADRLKDQKDQAKRGWNKAGLRLTAPVQLSLFNSDPVLGSRSFRIALPADIKAQKGDELLLQQAEEDTFITRGPEIISRRENIPACIMDELKIGDVICLEVIEVGSIANTLEVAPK